MSRSGSHIGQNTKPKGSVFDNKVNCEEGIEVVRLPVLRCWTGISCGTPPQSLPALGLPI